MEKEIGKINKNDTSDIVIRVDDFNNLRGLTIREFVTSDRYTGFTKSGVRIVAKDFPKFKEMINSISEEDMKQEPETEEPKSEKPEEQETLSEQKTTEEESKDNLPDY